MSTPLLDIRQLRAGYGEAEVLHGVNLSVSQGEFVCIIGANTAGKVRFCVRSRELFQSRVESCALARPI